jgi:hypothetical protein
LIRAASAKIVVVALAAAVAEFTSYCIAIINLL